MYILLKNDNLKYTGISKEGRLILSHYCLSIFFFSVIIFFFVISFQTLTRKEISRLQSMLYIVNFEFLV